MILPKRNKYGNTKIIVEGIKFDSKLEAYLHKILKQEGMDFDFQVNIELVPKFRFQYENIRAIAMRVDFLLRYNGRDIYIDTKGFATAEAKLKYKMLKYKFKTETQVNIIWLKTQKEVNSYISKLKEETQEWKLL
jgi:hypothetical protein